VPKRILELMNVEKLTRENVASHLQVKFLHITSPSLLQNKKDNNNNNNNNNKMARNVR
jgi:hypothetical protein